MSSQRTAYAGMMLALAGLSTPMAHADDAKLKALLKERLEVLQQAEREVEQSFRAGQVPVDQMVQANQAVLKAQLDLTESKKERLVILEKAIVNARRTEDYATTATRAGVVPSRELLKAKAGRLAAEIALERAKLK